MEAYWRNRDYPPAEKVARELLENYPSLIKAHLILWHLYGVKRHEEQGGLYLEKARALDPLNLVARDLFEKATSGDPLGYLAQLETASIPGFDPAKIRQ